MTWYRNIFVDTLSSNSGAIRVESSNLINKVFFRQVPNANKYTLFVRFRDDPFSNWVAIDERSNIFQPTEDSFMQDDFSWTDERDDDKKNLIEYKVEIEVVIPQTSEGYYISGFDGKSDDEEDIEPAIRVPGIYEKVYYSAGGIFDNINQMLTEYSDGQWGIDVNAGQYEVSFSSAFNTVTNIDGTNINWRTDGDDLGDMSDEEFTNHLTLLKNNWAEHIASKIREKQQSGLNMATLGAYLSDPEIKYADDQFSYGLYLAGRYQYTQRNDVGELANNLYFTYDPVTKRASATSKANIFVEVWLEQLYYDLISESNLDLQLESKFIHYNLPYRFPTFGLREIPGDVSQKTQYLLNIYKTMSGEFDGGIDGLNHETIQRIYDLCGTFVDFYPATYADDKDTWIAFIHALDSFGSPGKNTLMASGQYNGYAIQGSEPCSNWKGHPDLVSKPYYNEGDWFTLTEDDTTFTQIPLTVWIYLQDYIVTNTNLNFQRFYQYGPDSTMLRWDATPNSALLEKLNTQIDGFGTPYSEPPTEQNKRDWAYYRAYGQWTPNKDYTVIQRPGLGTPRREFIPDHRPIFGVSMSVDTKGDPSITVNGLTEQCDSTDASIEIQGASAKEHWKMNVAPLDSDPSNFLYPPCPEKPWLQYGYSTNRKSNPNTTNPDDDFILNLVHEDPNNPGDLEDAYRRGYRRFMIRGIFGMRTDASGGSAVPSAIWSAGDPNLETWNDYDTIGNSPEEGMYEYPFTSNGNLMSMDPAATKGDAQESVRRFLKPWIESKAEQGDPVDLYMYGGYQPAFYADGSPARGNLSMSFFVSEGAWQNNSNNPLTGVPWRQHFPLPDMSLPEHVDFFDGEYYPWMDIGAKGFIIDGASNAGALPDGSGVPVGNANPPINRIPGVFDYFRDDLRVDVLGEAIPLISYADSTAALNEDLYRETGFMAYSHDTFWGNKWRNIVIDPIDSEIHIFLLWGFNGGWQKRETFPGSGVLEWVHVDQTGGINNRYASIDPTIDNVVYDINGIKAEIDQMWDQGFVVSSNIGRYSTLSPPNEASGRNEIMNYIALGRDSRNSPSAAIIGGGADNTARIANQVQHGIPLSYINITSDKMLTANESEYRNATESDLRTSFTNFLNEQDSFGVVRNTYLNDETTGYVLLDIDQPKTLERITDYWIEGNRNSNTQEVLDWFIQGAIKRIKVFKEFCPNAKVSLTRFGNPDNTGEGAANTRNQNYQDHLNSQMYISNITYGDQNLFQAVDWMCPVLIHSFTIGKPESDRILGGERIAQLLGINGEIFNLHGETKPIIPILSFRGTDQLAFQFVAFQNATEINFLGLLGITNRFLVDHDNAADLEQYAGRRDNIINELITLRSTSGIRGESIDESIYS